MDIYQTDSLNFIFMQAVKLHFHAVHAMLSVKEVYPGQPPLLQALSDLDGQCQKELAAKMQITPATLTVMIGRMEKTGLVERKPDAVDQRMSRVYLTRKGRVTHRDVQEAMKVMETLCFENFTQEEKIIFRRLLLQMYENLKNADFKQDQKCTND